MESEVSFRTWSAYSSGLRARRVSYSELSPNPSLPRLVLTKLSDCQNRPQSNAHFVLNPCRHANEDVPSRVSGPLFLLSPGRAQRRCATVMFRLDRKPCRKLSMPIKQLSRLSSLPSRKPNTRSSTLECPEQRSNTTRPFQA